MFFSPLHILYMFIPLLLTAVLYFVLRNKSLRTKKICVFSIALLNTAQHILKPYIYPQYAGEPLGARSTAYNMCALLILMSPIVFLIGSELWKNFVFYIGSIAGVGSLCSTYWLTAATEEQIRFVICHGLLLIASFLPGVLGIYQANWRKFWRLPFVFFGCLLILIANNIITFKLGIVGYLGDMTLSEFLVRENPCWAMGPPVGYPFIISLVKPFTPSAFLTALGGVDTPILWFFFPMIILFWVCGLLLGFIFDNERMRADFKLGKQWLGEKYAKIKAKLKKN